VEAEKQARWRVEYEKVKAERDKLAAELANIYPAFADKVADLLPRIEANDRVFERINDHALPAGANRLLVVELVARDLPSFRPKPSTHVPRLTEELRVPAFRHPSEYPGERYAWPRGYRAP
jgi:hypothetical protein